MFSGPPGGPPMPGPGGYGGPGPAGYGGDMDPGWGGMNEYSAPGLMMNPGRPPQPLMGGGMNHPMPPMMGNNNNNPPPRGENRGRNNDRHRFRGNRRPQFQDRQGNRDNMGGPNNRSNVQCKHYLIGKCRHGDDCKYLHAR